MRAIFSIQPLQAMESYRIENCVTVVATAATIVGAYAFGARSHAWWGLLILLNTNYVKQK